MLMPSCWELVGRQVDQGVSFQHAEDRIIALEAVLFFAREPDALKASLLRLPHSAGAIFVFKVSSVLWTLF